MSDAEAPAVRLGGRMGSRPRRFVSAVTVLVIVAMLASCGLVFGSRSDNQNADAQMELIADALNAHDAAALKAMFSSPALERAVDIDERLEYLLSFFPNGDVTWDREVVGMEGSREGGERTDLLHAYYTLFADGSEFRLYFALYTVNDVVNPRNVGIYAMGVSPVTDRPPYGPEHLFSAWAGSIHIDMKDERFFFGYPGVYFPVYDSAQVSDLVMKGIVEEIDSQDSVGLEERFAAFTRTALGDDVLGQVQALFGELPDGEVIWEPLPSEPLIRRPPNGNGAVLLLATYPVSSGASLYWVSFAVSTMNTTDPTRIGINAVGVAPRTASGDSPQELALFAWLDAFQIDAGPAPGFFISE